MTNKHVVECVDRSFQDICSCVLPFGGKVMVFGGNFRQILPVVKHGSRTEIVSACLNRSHIWRYVRVMKLTINMRLQKASSQAVHDVREFSNFLLRVGEGTEHENIKQMIHINNNYVVPGDKISDLVTSVYSHINESYTD
ncbi:hypothetical protein, partial [Salmonella sp. s51228]|uniref:hypothetical protein n=1 Tax=Salmonella sp. s51228 TaxID=3159652 RepID=UPI0039811F58